MGFFDDEYEIGSDDYVDNKLNKILAVYPNYLNDFKYNHGRFPRSEEIMQEHSIRSVNNEFNFLMDPPVRRRRNDDYQDYSNMGFWASVGTIFTSLGELIFDDNNRRYEDEYYEDEDDEYY